MKKKRAPKIPVLLEKAEKAMKVALHQVFKEHRLRNLPIYVWENNKVVKIPPHRLPR